MRRYELFEREFTESEFEEFVDYYGIYKWHAYCGAFEHAKETRTSNGITLTVRIPASNHTHSTKVRYLTEMGFQKIGLIKQ